MKWLISCVFLFVSASSVLSLDEEGAKEGTCFETNTYEDLDWDWLGAVRTWYFPLSSKLSLFRAASDILSMKVEDIPESFLPYACLTLTDLSVATGFNKTWVEYKTDYTKEGRLWMLAVDNPYAKAGVHTVLYSDNKNYAVGGICWEDGQRSWWIWSQTPVLTKPEEEKALEVLREMGFKPNSFMARVQYDEDKCLNIGESREQDNTV